MQSLKEVYARMVQTDHVKIAQARAAAGLPPKPDLSQADPALLKQAQDYDRIGRILAHQVFADLVKEAVDEANVPEEKKEETVESLLAAARGEAPAEKKEEKKEGEGESEKKEDAASAEEGEKKEAARRRILTKMAQDPAYFSYLLAKHQAKIR